MEYIHVSFDPYDIRNVIANGSTIGQTETDLSLPSNYYEITLSGSGYAPPMWGGLVSGTLPERPLRIAFSKI